MVQKKKTIRDIVPGIPETKSPFLPEQKPPQPSQPSDIFKGMKGVEPIDESLVKGAKVEFPTQTGGTTRISRGGEVFDLTKEEHDVFMGKGGKVTPNVLGARKIEKDVEKEILIKRELEKLKLRQEISERFEASQLPPIEAAQKEPSEELEGVVGGETSRAESPSVTQPVQEPPEKLGILGVVSNILFGNFIETNPFTGQPNIDPKTGEQFKTQANVFPLVAAGAGAIAGAAKGGAKIAQGVQTMKTSGIGWDLYSASAKSAGWKFPLAARAKGFVPSVWNRIAGTSAVASKFSKSIFSLGKLAALGGVGAIIKVKASAAQAILATSLGEMGDLIKDVEENRIGYSEAQIGFEMAVGNIDSAEKTANRMSRIDMLGLLGLEDTLQRFLIARRTTIPTLRLKLDEARLLAVANRQTKDTATAKQSRIQKFREEQQ